MAASPTFLLAIVEEMEESFFEVFCLGDFDDVEEGLGYQEHRNGYGNDPARGIIWAALVEQRFTEYD